MRRLHAARHSFSFPRKCRGVSIMAAKGVRTNCGPLFMGGGAVIFTAFLECFCGDSDSLRPADRRVSSFAFRNQRHSSSINRDSSFCFYSKFFLFWTTARKMTKQKKTVGPSDRSVSANEVLMDLRLCQIVGGKSRPFCWTRPDQKNPNGHPMKT